jgi:glyoxylase-like metal-dependent hydrolase (beta-lactamase superfamily II)
MHCQILSEHCAAGVDGENVREEVLPNIFQIKIPLPGDPLGSVNSYLIRGNDRSLLIDAGYNRTESERALLDDIERLNIDVSKLDLLMTHMHCDHAGLIFALARRYTLQQVYGSEIDAGLLRDVGTDSYWLDQGSAFIAHGFPPGDMERQFNHIRSLFSGGDVPFHYLHEGDIIKVGDYWFTCLMTPGHTHGHLCLYEADRRCLISGDHILPGISPTVTAWREAENPLRNYIQSLNKIYKLDVDLVLPGHRKVFRGCRGRISELRSHHQARLDEVMGIMQKGAMSAYQVASLMSWNTHGQSWEQLPPAHRYFATGETVAHLKYLEQEQKILTRRNDQGGIMFRIAGQA